MKRTGSAGTDEEKRARIALDRIGREQGWVDFDDLVIRLREAVALSTEADFRDARADRVSLLTMHAAKGLEFAIVFVVGMEAGLTPFSWETVSGPEDGAQAEERRLFYVAMTRAKDRLFLTRAAERFWHGTTRSLAPSSFLGEIAGRLMTGSGATMRRRRQRAQLNLF